MNSKWLKVHWKLTVNIVTLAALVMLVFLIRNSIRQTLSDIVHVRAYLVLLLIPIEFVDYHAQVKFYQKTFEIVGNKLSYWYLFMASLELNFVNHVFPSGGVTGISYFSLRLRNGKTITSGKATLVHSAKLILQFLAFEIVLVIGVICLAVMGRVNGLVILVSGMITTIMVGGTIFLISVASSRKRLNLILKKIAVFLNLVINKFKKNKSDTINLQTVERIGTDFHDNYLVLREKRSELKWPFFYAFLANLAEVMAIYAVYIAFGKFVNFGAVVLGYAIANIAGLISVMPGGVGVYEGLMTLVLAITGIPPGESLPITITYRIVNTLIQIPPGYYLYQRALNRGYVGQFSDVKD